MAGTCATGQLLVLRSTVYPGRHRAAWSSCFARRSACDVDVAFCPERIAEGKAMDELFDLPQIVSGRTPEVRERAGALFGRLTDSIVELEPEEAELAKLFTNTWRYIKFAAANQFYMMANDHGLDFERDPRRRSPTTTRAPRTCPGAGFAAGPCLFKDTMQLAAFTDNTFVLGHSAMLVNEGLPLYLVSRLEKRYDLADMTVGILGMAFKGGQRRHPVEPVLQAQADPRFKAARGARAPTRYVTADAGSGARWSEVLERADLLIIGAPHQRVPRAWPPTSRSSTSGTCWATGHDGIERRRVTVVIPAYNEGERIVPVPGPHLRRRASPSARSVVVVDFPDDTTVPVLEEYAPTSRGSAPSVNTYGRGPANAIRYGIDNARRRSSS